MSEFEALTTAFNKFSTQNCRTTKTTKPALAVTTRRLRITTYGRGRGRRPVRPVSFWDA